MDASVETNLSTLAAAIGEPARARMLLCLMDGQARTSTELATVADVSPSTASMHLARLKDQSLVAVMARGKHRYYRLEGPSVAAVLEALTVFSGERQGKLPTTAPSRLWAARSCYDHMAGQLAVALHDHLVNRAWLVPDDAKQGGYELTGGGERALIELGIDTGSTRALRRRFACSCLDWSERRPHLGGALGAALLNVFLNKKWLRPDLDSRALNFTPVGRREIMVRFGICIERATSPAGDAPRWMVRPRETPSRFA
ncbi:MAG: winged helix-turn-helix domain-containing protein [Steroidobacteraceae bacterium]